MRQNGGWLRLYCDILENPKLRTLPESTQLFFFWCLCLHKRGWLVGKSDAEIAYSLRLKVSVVVKRLQELKEADLLLSDNSPKGWEECQSPSDSSTERTRKYRERQKGERSRNGDGTSVETVANEGAKRHCDALDKIREDKRREEESTGARPEGDDSKGELPALPSVPGLAVSDDPTIGVTITAMSEAAELVGKCRVVLERLLGLGPDWARLELEHLVDLVREHPEANLDEVVSRLCADWKGQRIPMAKTPPMLVRQYLTWNAADRKQGTKTPQVKRARTVEEIRMERLGGPRKAEG